MKHQKLIGRLLVASPFVAVIGLCSFAQAGWRGVGAAAAIVGIGLAIFYVIALGLSLIDSADKEPPRRRSSRRKGSGYDMTTWNHDITGRKE